MDIKWRFWKDNCAPVDLDASVNLLFRYRRAKVREDFIDDVVFSGAINARGFPSFAHWTGWEHKIPSEEALEWAFSPYPKNYIRFGFEDQLLPSPFSGLKPKIEYWGLHHPWKPERFKLCHSLGERDFTHPKALIDMWNTRC